MEESKEVVLASGFQGLEAAAKAGAVTVDDSDFEGAHYEEPKLRFIQVRQKDLRDEGSGRVIREPGRFRTGKVKDLTYPDHEELLVTVLDYVDGNVYFASLDETEPTCKSLGRVIGSRDRTTDENGRPIFGECGSCWYSQWGSGGEKRKKCRENRQLLCIDWGTETPIVLRLTVSSLQPWQAYDEFVKTIAKKFFAKEGNVPFIHHKIAVKLRTQYKSEPAGHYVVQFVNEDGVSPVFLPKALQEKTVEFRQKYRPEFIRAVETEEFEAEDVVGAQPTN